MSDALPVPSDGAAPFWTLRRLCAALALGGGDDRPIAGISTDTRTVQASTCFLALRGEQFDGHDFLADAVAKGAAALIVHDAARAAGLGVPVLEVADTRHALGALGRYKRRAWGRPVIAVGGSNGKTSTKELIRGALSARLLVHATHGNLNNQIGVPLTLLALPDDADVAVIEVGTNEPGEIAILRAIVEPDIAVVTAIQEEHLEGFGDLAGVLAEEASLCDGIATAIVPQAESELLAEAQARAARVVEVGLGAGTLAASSHGLHEDGRGWCEVEGVRVEVPMRGVHNLRNAMLALAVARECGLSLDEAARGIGAIDTTQVPAMRSSVLPLGAALLLNDAYNANPGSARAAIALLGDVAGQRPRVIILGTMRELGTAAARSHREIAEAAVRSGARVVAGIGEFAAALEAAAPNATPGTRLVTADDVPALWPQLEPLLPRDAAILLKASRGVRLERIVPLLTQWSAPSGER